jgi:hypothetical protein
MRHYSKIIVELPDGPSDPPYAIVSYDCDVCGEEEVRIHMHHIGGVLRSLRDVLGRLGDDGSTEEIAVGQGDWAPSTPSNKQKLREYLDRAFPDWKAGRLKERMR